MDEHPVKQPIRMIQIPCDEGGNPREYIVGRDGITRIEATTKSGLHADIAYIRVWQGDEAVGEFCQHHLSGVWFEQRDGGVPGGCEIGGRSAYRSI